MKGRGIELKGTNEEGGCRFQVRRTRTIGSGGGASFPTRGRVSFHLDRLCPGGCGRMFWILRIMNFECRGQGRRKSECGPQLKTVWRARELGAEVKGRGGLFRRGREH